MGIEPFFRAAIRVRVPIALWKLPGDEKIYAAIELSDNVSLTKIEFETPKTGFALSPFINPDGKRTIFLNADLCFNTISKELVEDWRIKKDVEKQQRKNKFVEVLNHLIIRPETNPLQWYNKLTRPRAQTSKTHYCKLVANGIKAIRKKQFKKLVLSRTKVIPLPDDFNIINLFQKLCAEYPDAFVSLVSIPGIGTWMGASPEILVSIGRENIFRTVSLAGTQRGGDELSPLDISVWTEKEFEEQAFVSRYIINCFRRSGLRAFKQEGPRTVRAGNLFHLRTDFSADLNELQTPRLGSMMLRLLHPTPAVCGVPKGKALAYIPENEEYDRQFYTGFLGPVHVGSESHLYVNLRCMQLYKKQAVLYAGAGITSESIPENEWEETEIKCNTLLRVITCKEKTASSSSFP